MTNEAQTIEYIDKLHPELIEVGNITPQDLARLVSEGPLTTSPTSFSLNFRAKEGAIPKSSGKIKIDGERFDVTDVGYPYNCTIEGFKVAVQGGKLEKLSVDFPGYHAKEEDFFKGGAALKAFRDAQLKILEEGGYELSPSGFVLAHHLVRTRDQHPGFFSSSYVGRITISTEVMAKGEEPRKLTFRYTSDIKGTPEFKAYKELIRK